MHKKGDPTKRENQRPISHIQEVGKLTEKVVAEQIIEYMVENNLMKEEQHGALKDHSPITALASIQDILLNNAESKKLTGILLIDLTAAYDLIDHEILDKKLEAYNFGLGVRKWIRSYLNMRTQSVKIKGKESISRFLNDYGAPQGSIMAGLLYLIYANDIPNLEENKKTIMYVNDTTDMITGKNITTMKQRLQEGVNTTLQWTVSNKMVIAEKRQR